MPSWKKVITSGSDAILNSLIVTGSVAVTGSITANSFSGSHTGSLLGTASYVTGSIYTSANPALSASYAVSSSYVLSSSYALTSSYLNNLNQNLSITGSLILSSSNAIELFVIGGTQITGSTFISGSLIITGSVLATQGGFTGSLLGTASYVTGSIHTSANPALSASYALSSSYALTASYLLNTPASTTFPYTGSAIISGSLTIIQSGSFGLVITGSSNTSSLIVSGGFTRILGSGSGIFTVTGSAGPILEISDSNAATSKLLVFSSASTDVFSIYRNRTVEVSGSLSIVGANGPSASVSFTYLSGSTLASVTVYASGSSGPSSQSLYISGNLCPHPGRLTGTPTVTSSFDLGQPGAVWRRLYVGRNSVYFVDEETDQTGSIGLDAAYGFTYNNFPIINAQGGISSSWPFAVKGSTLYSLFDLETGAAASTINSVFIGNNSGYSASNADYSNFIGYNAGLNAYQAGGSNFFGEYAGQNAGASYNSNFIGTSAGDSADSASRSNFLGNGAGYSATNANDSNFFGYKAGWQQNSSDYSNFFGYQAGFRAIGFPLGSNNIIIGTNITLEGNRQDSINLGGILFGTGSYSTTTGNPYSGSNNGRIGINVVNPQYELDVSGSANFSNNLTVGGLIFSTSSWAVNALTASSADSFVVRNDITASNGLFTGIITAQTLVVQTITSSTDYVTGSTRFGSQLANTHQFTGSVSITGSLSLAGGIASLTSSYSVSSSYAISSSRATNAGNASTIDVSVFGADVDSYVLISNVAGTTGVAVGSDADLRYNSSTNKLTVGSVSATSLTGSLFGTSSWAFSSSVAISSSYALSSSYAVTASHAISSSNFVVSNTLVVDQTITRFASSASSTAGSNIMFNLATGSYTSAFFKYVVTNGSNVRSGEVMSAWSGSTATYTDFSTPDLGTTSAVTTSVSIVSSQMQFNVTTNTSGWNIKSIATLM